MKTKTIFKQLKNKTCSIEIKIQNTIKFVNVLNYLFNLTQNFDTDNLHKAKNAKTKINSLYQISNFHLK